MSVSAPLACVAGVLAPRQKPRMRSVVVVAVSLLLSLLAGCQRSDNAFGAACDVDDDACPDGYVCAAGACVPDDLAPVVVVEGEGEGAAEGEGEGEGGVPAGWTCTPSFFGDNDCDCGCGVVDVDCTGGCIGAGCQARGCSTCHASGGGFIDCFDICDACSVDADCAGGGQCVAVEGGPNFCTQPCARGPDPDLCGKDGNFGSEFEKNRRCDGDDLLITDLCNHVITLQECAATGLQCGTHSVCAGFRCREVTECFDGHPAGTIITDDTCEECSEFCTSLASAPDVTLCSADCVGGACSGSVDLGCNASNHCVPLLTSLCSSARNGIDSVDSFGHLYSTTACSLEQHCSSSGGTPHCESLRGDGATCSTNGQCASGLCRTSPLTASVQYCSRSCNPSGNDCGAGTSCSETAPNFCEPLMDKECDGNDIIGFDNFGRSYPVIDTCTGEFICGRGGTNFEGGDPQLPGNCINACSGVPTTSSSGVGQFTYCSGEELTANGAQCCRDCESSRNGVTTTSRPCRDVPR